MSETTTEPQVPEQEPPPTPQPQPEPTPTPTPTPETPPEPSKEAKQLEPDWRDKRIATLTRRLREEQERSRQQPQVQQPVPPAPQEDFTRQQIETRARELSSIQDFNRRCDEAAVAGRAAFGEMEFNGRINNLHKLVDNTDPQSVQAYNSLLIAALDTGEGPKVLFNLGSDLNEAQRILALQPTRMAVELTKRALSPEVQISSAPKPIVPVGSRGGQHTAIAPDDPERADHLAIGEWMRRREQQLKERAQ